MAPAPIELSIDNEKIREMPMVDLAFMILKKANEPYYYPDLMKEVARQRSLTDEEAADMIAQLYTEINIDGRFACVGTNLWGLKRWYPLEKSEDPVVSSKRPRIINDEDDDDLDEDTTFNADDESFDDASDDEDDDLFDGDEDDVDEDVIVDDEIEDEEDEIEGEELDEDLEEEEEEEEEEYQGDNEDEQ